MSEAKLLRLIAAVALAIAAGLALVPGSAHAQFFGDRFGQPWGRQPPPPPSGGFFSFPFMDRPPPTRAPAESYKAPPPHRPATQPAGTVLVIGDSLADWLGYGLEEIYADSNDVGVVRRIRPSFGLVRTEGHSDTPEWAQTIKDILASETPRAIVVMFGLNDRSSLRDPLPQRPGAKPVQTGKEGQPGDQPAQPAAQPAQTANQPATASPPGPDGKPAPGAPDAAQQPGEPPRAAASRLTPGATYEFHTEQWAELYSKRIGEMIAALKTKGVPVLWVGLPAIRGPRATGDMNYLDDLYRAAAEKAGITYVDIWNGFVDENGRYTVEGPDFEGQTRRLRAGDGIHFTRFGALKLAHLVDQELSRALTSRPAPLALPVPQASAPAKSGAVRPEIGPVLPLAALGGTDDGDVLAGGGKPVAALADPVATSVLVRGDPLTAPAGRADNFTWPPGGSPAAAPPAPNAASPPK